MFPTKSFSLLTIILLPLLVTPAEATGSQPRAQAGDQITEYPAGVAWWGTWEGALAEGQRTEKPILLLSAAPQCHGVPGIW
ncbi:MAG: hypothetical protein AAEJ04_04800 [Planctomycetota bacterium]